MSLRMDLRSATGDDHERLDAAFGRFDLADRKDYRAFLRAHGRALLPIEQALAGSAVVDEHWRRRGPLLIADLATLDDAPPPAPPLPPAGDARLWGMRYVVEGSRLGGALLARQVGADLPRDYLGAHHGKGEWRAFLDALEAAGDTGGAEWRADAMAGARDAFALFAESVATEASHDR